MEENSQRIETKKLPQETESPSEPGIEANGNSETSHKKSSEEASSEDDTHSTSSQSKNGIVEVEYPDPSSMSSPTDSSDEGEFNRRDITRSESMNQICAIFQKETEGSPKSVHLGDEPKDTSNKIQFKKNDLSETPKENNAFHISKMFEHFIVVGRPPSLWTSDPPISSSYKPPSKDPPRENPSDENPDPSQIKIHEGDVYEPEILYQYPSDKELRNIKVKDFCFPEKITITGVARTKSCSSLNEIIYGQSHLYNQSYSHIFRLSGENFVLYGICVVKNELLEDVPSFLAQGKPSPLERRHRYLTAPRCYCILSRRPFFSLHFDILVRLLVQDRLFRMSTEMELPEEIFPLTQIKRILDSYYSQLPPKGGTSCSFTIPGEAKPFTFYCPLGDEESRLIADWALVPALASLSMESLLLLYHAALLEKSTVVVSQNGSALSCVVLSVLALITPLKWQGLLIPILPSNLSEMLHAPVPFISGIKTLNTNIEGLIIDLDNNKSYYSFTNPLPKLPNYQKLYKNVLPYHTELRKHTTMAQQTYNSDKSPSQRAAQAILDCFHSYTRGILDQIRKFYRASEMKLNSPKTLELLNENFIASSSFFQRDFVRTFLTTQNYSVFSEILLREAKDTKNLEKKK